MEKKASLVGRLLSENQMSEAFINSMFLALSGGFQDAYTYNCRDEVFSNAQTGNVVLMSQNFLEGNFTAGLRYLFPILFFAMGVFLAENFQEHYRYAKRLHWRQVLLAAEIVILAIVGFIPSSYNMLAAMLVSFACAIQVQTFRKVGGYRMQAPCASETCEAEPQRCLCICGIRKKNSSVRPDTILV